MDRQKFGKERHVIVNGVTIKDIGDITDVVWHVHVSSVGQVDSRYQMMKKFRRGEVRYFVWVNRDIGKQPTVEAMRDMVKEHYEYILNPFGLPDGV